MKQILEIAPKAFLVLAPLLYTYGFSYELGRLVAFGVPPNVVERGPQEYLILSFYALGQLSNLYWDFSSEILWSAVILAAALALLFVLVSTGNTALKKRRLKAGSKTPATHSDLVRLGAIGLAAGGLLPYLFFLLVFSVLLLLGWPFFLGFYGAKDEMASFPDCKKSTRLGCIVVYRDGKEIATGLLVTKSSDAVLIYNGQKTLLVKTDRERIEFAAEQPRRGK